MVVEWLVCGEFSDLLEIGKKHVGNTMTKYLIELGFNNVLHAILSDRRIPIIDNIFSVK